jgi:prepilin-type processing-associated H-X9-DG protein
MMILPTLGHRKSTSPRISCVSNLKQVGTAFRLFANDYDGKYPFQVLSGLGTNRAKAFQFAPLDTNDATQVWKLFQAAGNELGSPRILVCPEDADRSSASDFGMGSGHLNKSFAHPSNRLNALSYFYGLNARDDAPNHLVAGDRNLTTSGTDLKPPKDLLTGRVDLARFSSDPKDIGGQLRWGLGLHDKAGNVGFSDGHVEQLTSFKLREAVRVALSADQGSNQVLWLPNLPRTKR